MKRYQVYLNSSAVNVLDDFEEKTSITRSAIIRMAINSLAQNLAKVLPGADSAKGPLDEVVGVIKTSGKGIRNSSVRVDDLYFGK